MIKNYAIIGLAILAALGVCYGLFKPARTIETTKAIIWTDHTDRTIAQMKAEVSRLKTEKAEIERRIAEARTEEKNIKKTTKTTEEYDKDGRIAKRTTEDSLIDTSTTRTTTATAENAKTTAEAKEDEKKIAKIDTESTDRTKQVLTEKKDTGGPLALYAGPITNLSFDRFGAMATLTINQWLAVHAFYFENKIGAAAAIRIF